MALDAVRVAAAPWLGLWLVNPRRRSLPPVPLVSPRHTPSSSSTAGGLDGRNRQRLRGVRRSAAPDTHGGAIIEEFGEMDSTASIRPLDFETEELIHDDDIPDLSKVLAELSELTRTGRWQEAIQVFAGALEDGADVDDVTVPNKVLQACARARNWQAALSVMDNMMVFEIDPDIASFEAVFRAAMPRPKMMNKKGRRVRQRSDVWDNLVAKLQRCVEMTQHEFYKTSFPDPDSYRAAIRATGFAFEWEQSLSMFNFLQKRNITVGIEVYGDVINSCQGSQRWREVLYLLNDARCAELSPNADCLRAAICSCDQLGLVDESRALLHEMRTLNMPADAIAYRAAMNAHEQLVATGISQDLNEWAQQTNAILLDEAEQTLLASGARPDDEEPWAGANTFSSLISCCALAGGQWERALQLLDAAEDRAVEVATSDSATTSSLRSAAALACYRGGRGDIAFELIEDLRSRELKPDLVAVHIAILEFKLRGDDTNARKLYMETRADMEQGWILGKTGMNVTSCSFEIARLALRIRLEDARQFGIGGDLEIITPRGKEDAWGFDSPLKRFLYMVTDACYGFKADFSSKGLLVVDRGDMKKMYDDYRGAVKKTEALVDKAQKMTQRKMKQNLMYSPEGHEEGYI